MSTALWIIVVLGLRNDLASPHYRVRQAAAAKVHHMPLAATPGVEVLAHDRDAQVRDWAQQELGRRHDREVTERAHRLMNELDPKSFSDRFTDYGWESTHLKELTRKCYLDPEMAVRWAEIAIDAGLIEEDLINNFVSVFASKPFQEPPEVGPYDWGGPVFPYWDLKKAWEGRWLRQLGSNLPKPRIVP